MTQAHEPRDPRELHRDHPDRKIAGVCAALAERIGVSVTVTRAVFLLLVLPPFHGIGISLYVILWFLMPPRPGADSGLDRTLEALRGLLSRPERYPD